MLRVLRHRTYRRLFIAQCIALLGTGLATVALALLAHDIVGTDAGRVLGTALALKMVAYIGVAPLASALLAHRTPQRVLVVSNAIRLVTALALIGVDDTWQIYALILILQGASAAYTPTFQALIPRVLPDEDDYTAALSLSRLAYDTETIVTPVLAAVALLLLPGHTLFVGTAAGFAAATALVLATRLPGRTRPSDASFTDRLTRGIRLMTSRPQLRPVLALNMVVAAAGALPLVHTVVIVKTLWDRDDSWVAILLGTIGIGSMLMAVALPALLRRTPERRWMLGGSAVLVAAIAVAPLAWHADGPLTLILLGTLWALVGAGWSAVETPVGRLIKRSVSDAERPAVFAAQFAASHACWLLTYPLVGFLGTWRLDAAAAVLAAIAAVSALLAWRWWPRTRHARPHTPEREPAGAT